MAKKQVIIGLLGTVVDAGSGATRWRRWRPTVAMCRHEGLCVDRVELIAQKKYGRLAEQVVEDIRTVSSGTEVRIHWVEFQDPWDFQEVYSGLLDFAKGYAFSPEREEYLVHITTGTHVAQICMFLLTEAHYFPGKLLQTSPPRGEGGRRSAEAGGYSIIDLDLSKYDKIASRFAVEQKESLSFLKSGIETRNGAFNKLIEQIERVAIHSKAPLLLMGPTGAGKSQLARRIFELKKFRRQVSGNFVEVNCATIRGDGAMAALFGHTKGAFTGAIGARAGLLRAADGGVLFLDEVGELGVDEQAMLLRALEEKRFLPVGSDAEARSDFQLIAGTNRDLSAAVEGGEFREDLFARINLWTFRLPALKERREDIEPNVAYELEQFARENGSNVTFNKEARERFLAFAVSGGAEWRRNFRDLNAAINRMATLAAAGGGGGGARITLNEVEEEIRALVASWKTGGAAAGNGVLARHLSAKAIAGLDRFDRVQLEEVLRVCEGARSLSEAGRELFAASRAKKKSANDADRLRKYLARFGLSWGELGGDGDGSTKG
ncbi:MAG TPA: RNA repair transcriptional activator RtcR [Phycisphaerae bacterium]|nr:RNA repair transcriptional activator RtcR [Phycisphaerae bacterium]